MAYLKGMTLHVPFNNSYAALPANFFARVAPTPVAAPRLVALNRPPAGVAVTTAAVPCCGRLDFYKGLRPRIRIW